MGQAIDRIAPTRRPGGRVAGHQRWPKLSFLHWRVRAAELRPLVPAGPDGTLRRGQVHHAPYPLQPAELRDWDESLLAAAGITRPPDVSYLVPAGAVQQLVPDGLALQRLGPEGNYALFTFLTYRHGHFGFALLGPLRRLMPSPIQTNWRIHVVDPITGRRGIYFVTNAITSTLQAVVARLITEGMPMHVLSRGELVRDGDSLRVALDPGAGSAPDAELVLHRAAVPALSGAWAACFADYREFLAYCVPQDRALSSQPLRHRISRQEIQLGIPLDACTPLTGRVRSRSAEAIAGAAQPLCFHVDRAAFRFAAEAHDRRPRTT